MSIRTRSGGVRAANANACSAESTQTSFAATPLEGEDVFDEKRVVSVVFNEQDGLHGGGGRRSEVGGGGRGPIQSTGIVGGSVVLRASAREGRVCGRMARF